MRQGLALLGIPTLLMGLAGLGLGCPLVARQGANPTQYILTQGQYQAYYPFYALGEHLSQLAWMGLLGAALAMLTLWMWCLDGFHILPMLAGPKNQRLGGGRQVLLVSQAGWLGLMAALQWFAWSLSAATWRPHSPTWVYLAPLPTLCGVVVALWLARRGGAAARSLLVTLTVGLVLWLLLPDPLTASVGSGVVPPFMWTHFGPWQILGWQVAGCAFLGLAFGIGVCGLAPPLGNGGGGPAGVLALGPPEGGNGWGGGNEALSRRALSAGSALLALVLLLGMRWALLEHYQIGEDLRVVLHLSEQSVPGRTVVWLDSARPAHVVSAIPSRLTPTAVTALETWLDGAPRPSALTRGAVAALGNHALWLWQPDRALQWLAVQRDRQLHNSQLNEYIAELLLHSALTPMRAEMARQFSQEERFAWLGPEPMAQVAALLNRIGRQRLARSWADQAEQLGGDPGSHEAPTARVSGRLLGRGQPLAGIRLALLTGSAQAFLDEESELMSGEGLWRPRNRPCMNLRHLTDFYAVCETGPDGRFEFTGLDAGSYLCLARLEGCADVRVEKGCGMVQVANGQHLRLGELNLLETTRSAATNQK